MGLISIELIGKTPLVEHNIRLSDPFDPITKQIAELTKKRRKTEEDHKAIARLEWFGGLYEDASGMVPGIVVETGAIRKCLIQTAKTTKDGRAVERALSFNDLFVPLILDPKAPKTLDALYDSGEYELRKAVRVSGRVIMRVRPKFLPWAVQAEGFLMEDLLDIDDLQRIVRLAGQIEGLLDARNIGFGRFEGKVVEHE